MQQIQLARNQANRIRPPCDLGQIDGRQGLKPPVMYEINDVPTRVRRKAWIIRSQLLFNIETQITTADEMQTTSDGSGLIRDAFDPIMQFAQRGNDETVNIVCLFQVINGNRDIFPTQRRERNLLDRLHASGTNLEEPRPAGTRLTGIHARQRAQITVRSWNG